MVATSGQGLGGMQREEGRQPANGGGWGGQQKGQRQVEARTNSENWERRWFGVGMGKCEVEGARFKLQFNNLMHG